MKIKLLSFVALTGLLCACAPSQYIWVWENAALLNQGVTADSYKSGYNRANSQCGRVAGEVRIPAPDCRQIFVRKVCAEHDVIIYDTKRGTDIIDKNNCEDIYKEVCVNDDAINDAYRRKQEVYEFCMLKRNWREVQKLNPEWVEYQKDK